jgi:hypothetical protein
MIYIISLLFLSSLFEYDNIIITKDLFVMFVFKTHFASGTRSSVEIGIPDT